MFCIYFELLQIAQSIMLHYDFFVCNIYIMIFTKMVIIFWNMQTLLFLCKYLVVFLHLRDLAMEFAHLVLLEYFLVFDRDDMDELIHVLVPVIEH